jgi:predicted nucleic acid-binding protein
MLDPEREARHLAPTDSIRWLLASTHGRNSIAAVNAASEDGVFPPTFFGEPRPVVADTRWLAADVAYACRKAHRTTLITATNSQALRVFCSQHVIDEVMEHREIWSSKAKTPVTDTAFVERWTDEYLSMLRVVPDDSIPHAWLSPEERARVDAFDHEDRDDVPSVKLTLVTRGLYLCRDKPALRAAYGSDSASVEHDQWLDRLKAGSDAAELMRLLHGTGGFAYAAAYGLFAGGRRAYQSLGPASIPLFVAAAYGCWRWLLDPSRQAFRDELNRFGEFLGHVAEQGRERQAHFDAALPRVPTWDELLQTNPHIAVLGRACTYVLAREPRGHLSAQELATKLRSLLPCADARVRAVLRATPCFVEIYRGRWQLGAVAPRHLLTDA